MIFSHFTQVTGDYMKFTDEDIEKARNTDLRTFFESNGFEIKQEPRERFRLVGYAGLILFANTYYRHSTQTKGNAIDCLMNEFNYTFEEAITALTGISSSFFHPGSSVPVKKLVQPVIFQEPLYADNQKRAISYLINTRKIKKDVVFAFIKKGYLKQDMRGNLVFPFVDPDSKAIVGAEIVGTLNQVRFKQIAPGSNNTVGFNISFGTPTKLFIFESTIDLMSFISLYHKENFIQNATFVSMCALKKETARYWFLRCFEERYSCVDNDKFGIKFNDEFLKSELTIPFQSLYSELKDWNMDLIAKELNAP